MRIEMRIEARSELAVFEPTECEVLNATERMTA